MMLGTENKTCRLPEEWLARKIKEKGTYYNDSGFAFLLKLAHKKTL